MSNKSSVVAYKLLQDGALIPRILSVKVLRLLKTSTATSFNVRAQFARLEKLE